MRPPLPAFFPFEVQCLLRPSSDLSPDARARSLRLIPWIIFCAQNSFRQNRNKSLLSRVVAASKCLTTSFAKRSLLGRSDFTSSPLRRVGLNAKPMLFKYLRNVLKLTCVTPETTCSLCAVKRPPSHFRTAYIYFLYPRRL